MPRTNYESLMNVIPNSFILVDYREILSWYDPMGALGKRVTGSWDNKEVKVFRKQAVRRKVDDKKAKGGFEEAWADWVARYLDEAALVMSDGTYTIPITTHSSFELNKERYENFINLIKGAGKPIQVRRTRKVTAGDGSSTYSLVEPADFNITLHYADLAYRKNKIQELKNKIAAAGITQDDLTKLGEIQWEAKIYYCVLKEAVDQFVNDFVENFNESKSSSSDKKKEQVEALKKLREEITNLMNGNPPLSVSDLTDLELMEDDCKESLRKGPDGGFSSKTCFSPCKVGDLYSRIFQFTLEASTFSPGAYKSARVRDTSGGTDDDRFGIPHLKQHIKNARNKKKLFLSDPEFKNLDALLTQFSNGVSGTKKVNDSNFSTLESIWDQIESFGLGSDRQKKAYQIKIGQINGFRVSETSGFSSNKELQIFLVKRLENYVRKFFGKGEKLPTSVLGELKKYSTMSLGSFQRKSYNIVNSENSLGFGTKILDRLITKLEESGTPPGGGGDPNQAARQAAISEIRTLYQTCKSKGYFTSDDTFNLVIRPDIESKSGADIQVCKNDWLNRLWRTAARKELEAEVADKGGESAYELGDKLVDYLKRFIGEASIETEKNRLLDKIRNRNTDRLAEVEAAVAEIRTVLTNAGMDSQTETKELGNDWESNFKTDFRYAESAVITSEKQKKISVIDKFVAQNLTACQTIFASLEESLRQNGLNESILGTNWKANFVGKNDNEREAEKNRLLGLIEKAIEAKNISEGEKKTEKKKLITESARTAKIAVKTKLTTAHPKLRVKESEILAELLAPYKTIEEKLTSCQSIKEVAEVENQILVVIDQKRETKLNNIRAEAIAKIEKELAGVSGIQLGVNQDFKKSIQGMVDPDQIEAKQKYLLKIIQEQKAAQEKDQQQSGNSPSTSPKSTNWPKTLGIIALIVIPLVLMGGIIIHLKQRRKR